MGLFEIIARPKWLKFGFFYGILSMLISILASFVFALFLAPDQYAMILSAEPVNSIAQGQELPVLGGILATVCIIGGFLLSGIFSAIYWYISSWLYTLISIPLVFLNRILPKTFQMLFAGMIIPSLLLVLSVFTSIFMDMDFVGVVWDIFMFIMQGLWVLAIVLTLSIVYKITKQKLPL